MCVPLLVVMHVYHVSLTVVQCSSPVNDIVIALEHLTAKAKGMYVCVLLLLCN